MINNMLSLVFAPGKLVSRADLARQVDALAAWLKASPPRAGRNRHLLAGRARARSPRASASSGGIPLPRRTCDALVAAARGAGHGRRRIRFPRVERDMSFRHVTHFTVEFGDCDPAQIVFYPNFFRWLDAASRHYFIAAGVPLVERARAHDRHHRHAAGRRQRALPAPRDLRRRDRGRDRRSHEWRGKSFVMKHTLRRGDEVLAEGQEVRIFARRHPDDPTRIQAVTAPDSIRQTVWLTLARPTARAGAAVQRR